MHLIQSLLRPLGSKALIIWIAVFFSVDICLRNHYVGAVGVAKGRGDAFIRSLVDEEKKKLKTVGACVDIKNKTATGDLCAFEIAERGAEVVQKEEGTTSANALDVCVKFSGFKNETAECKKIYCFSLKSSVTFWVLAVGIPIALIVAIGVIIWLCCHFSYYMCCCCIFHMELPKWFKKAQAKAKVSPEGNTAKAKDEGAKDKGKETEMNKDKDKGKENEMNKDNDADKGKEDVKEKENDKEA